jgi:hypothetical protein
MNPGLLKAVFPAVLIVAGISFLCSPARAEQTVSADRINLGIVGAEEFEAGYIVIPGVPVFWESDVPWRLTLSSIDPDLGVSNDARYAKPLDSLQWRLSDEQAWMPLSQDEEEVTWGAERGSGVIYIDVIVLLDWLTDAPGEYRVDLVFTIEPL